MPVDLYGTAQIEELRAIADRHRLLFFEDACQAHGAAIGNRKAGAMGLSATFSFYPTKNMTTAEGAWSPRRTPTSRRSIDAAAAWLTSATTTTYRLQLPDDRHRRRHRAAQLAKLDQFGEVRRRHASVSTKAWRGLRHRPPGSARLPARLPQYTIWVERDRHRFQQRLASSASAPPSATSCRSTVNRSISGWATTTFPAGHRGGLSTCSLPVHPRCRVGLDRIIESVRKVATA
jgi:dTDP-4-amino-4,6-dideoxygalactose transaminase